MVAAGSAALIEWLSFFKKHPAETDAIKNKEGDPLILLGHPHGIKFLFYALLLYKHLITI